MKEEREQLVIEGLMRGDPASFDEIYSVYADKVYSFTYKYLQNKQDTEGVVQEVFITLWNRREKAGEIRNLNGWLFTVTFNLVRKRFRRMETERRAMESFALSGILDSPSMIKEVEWSDLMERAEEIIERLPERKRSVLQLSIKNGLNSKEIAELLHIEKRTVENHLSSARAFLRKAFRQADLIPALLFWILL